MDKAETIQRLDRIISDMVDIRRQLEYMGAESDYLYHTVYRRQVELLQDITLLRTWHQDRTPSVQE